MDWGPVFWFGGFTLIALAVAAVLLRWAHPLAGAVQLLVAVVSLIITIATWHAVYERAHPSPLPSCPTRAGVPCASHDPAPPSSFSDELGR
jgi:membrane protein implicated in regulation of membrane protease activity